MKETRILSSKGIRVSLKRLCDTCRPMDYCQKEFCVRYMRYAGSLSNGYRRPFSAMPFAFLAYCPASSVIFLTTSSLPASV